MMQTAYYDDEFTVVPRPKPYIDTLVCDAGECSRTAIAYWMREGGTVLYRCAMHPCKLELAHKAGLLESHHDNDMA
jgi:hypothetical protein